MERKYIILGVCRAVEEGHVPGLYPLEWPRNPETDAIQGAIMSFEMLMLGLTTLLLMLVWIPGSIAKSLTYGWNWLASNRSTEGLQQLPEWGQRCVRADANLRENYPAFAVAVLLLAFTGGFTPGTALASAMFLGARLVHIPAYIAGIPWLRTLAWGLGFLATLYLLFMALVALISF
jgi:uncharacterized MAPEG superfamily protein